MYIDADAIITIGKVVGAILAIGGAVFGVCKWFLEQKNQSKQIAELKKHHDDDIKSLKEETRLICEGLSACLDGLIQQGCNHSVPKAKEKLDEYLNKQAHE